MTGAQQSRGPVEVFFSYAHKDERIRVQLEKHLSGLKRQGVISDWNDRQIGAGEVWAGKINQHINSAEVILLLISADFLASDYCTDIEMRRAMERHEAREAHVIPVILRPCLWEKSPFGKLQALPKDAKAVTSWDNRDEAFLNIAEGIQRVVGLLSSDVHLSGSTSDPFLPVTPSALRQLPAPVRDFVGRAEEVDQLAKALSQADNPSDAGSICVVRGMGGLGKTELAYKVAQRVASEFPDGQLLIELRGESSNPVLPEKALQSIILTLDRDAKFPDNLTGIQAMYQSTLTGRRVLILADNAKSAEQVRSLMPPSGSALLITSRQRFALPGMMAVDLDTLPADAAESLMRQICPRIGDAAARLAQLCGYLPLALRVSASMLASDDTLRVERYLERLTNERDPLKLLHDPDDPAFDVEASLRLSYDALEPDAQNSLCQMSVFPSSFDLRVISTVLLPSGAADVEELLSLLRRRSLIEWDEEEQRYKLHDLVRAFAAKRLTDIGPVRRRHAQYYAQVVIGAIQAQYASTDDANDNGSDVASDELSEPTDVIYTESANIEAGWRWAQEHAGDSEADELILAYAKIWAELIYETPTQLLEAALAAVARLGRRESEMTILSQLAEVHLYSDTRQSIKNFEQALQIAKELNDREAEATILISIGIAYARLKETQQEIECYERALLASSKNLATRWLHGSALMNLGNANTGLRERCLYKASSSNTIHTFGDSTTDLLNPRQAIEYYEQALSIWRELNDRKAEGHTLAYQGFAHGRTGENNQARECYEQALTILEESLGGSARKLPLRGLLSLHYAEENYAAVHPYLEQLLEIASRQGERSGECELLIMMSNVENKLGNGAQALSDAELALEIARELGERQLEAETLSNLGELSAGLGDTNQASAYYERALPIVQELGNRQTETEILSGLGDLSLTLGDTNQASAYKERALLSARDLGDRDWTVRLLLALGDNYFDLDRNDDAIRVYQEAISLDPTSPSGYAIFVRLGYLYFASGRYDNARDAYQRAMALTSAASEQAQITDILGSMLFEEERYAEALATFQRATLIDPTHGHRGLGNSYYLLGRYDEALAEYQQAHQISPDHIEPVLGLARIHRKLDHKIEFEKEVAVARGLLGDESDYDGACVAAVSGEVDEALRLLKIALTNKEVTGASLRSDPDFDFIRDDPRFTELVATADRT